MAVGYDNIDVGAAAAHGITVCNTPGVLDETTADLAFLLILAAARLASEAEHDLRAGSWSSWGINQYLGQDVHDATLGLVGFGRIGRAVAARALGFGMRVIHHTRTPTGVAGFVADLDALLAHADFVSLHVPGGPATHHLIDARRLALMKPTAVLVNTARGHRRRRSRARRRAHAGDLFAAGLDVYEREPEIHPAAARGAPHGAAPAHRLRVARDAHPHGDDGDVGRRNRPRRRHPTQRRLTAGFGDDRRPYRSPYVAETRTSGAVDG